MLKFLQTFFLAIIALPVAIGLYEALSGGLMDNTTKLIVIITLSVVAAVGIAEAVLFLVRAKRK